MLTTYSDELCRFRRPLQGPETTGPAPGLDVLAQALDNAPDLRKSVDRELAETQKRLESAAAAQKEEEPK